MLEAEREDSPSVEQREDERERLKRLEMERVSVEERKK